MSLALEIGGVFKSYGRTLVLREVNLGLRKSEIVGLIGPNGAGKTTLLRIVAGLVRASSGHVRFADEFAQHRQMIYFGGGGTLPPRLRAERWASLIASRPAVQDRRPIRTLSRGARQLLGLRAILSDDSPGLVLLDEPWEGLDPDGTRWLTGRLREMRAGGWSMIVSSHRLSDLADVCDRYAFLVEGRLVVRSTGEISQDEVRGSDLLSVFDKLRGSSDAAS